MAEAFPLHWPEGWPRVSEHDRDWTLPGGRTSASWNEVVDRLMNELRLLGAEGIVLSTNQPLRRDGLPYAATRRIDDPGAAVYFNLNDRSLAMAQDRYDLLTDNIRSLVLAIEGMRKMQRHGGGHMMERAFTGFLALSGPDSNRHWTEVLGASASMSLEEVKDCYRRRARTLHPDRGGHDDAMTEVNLAWERAQEFFGGERTAA